MTCICNHSKKSGFRKKSVGGESIKIIFQRSSVCNSAWQRSYLVLQLPIDLGLWLSPKKKKKKKEEQIRSKLQLRGITTGWPTDAGRLYFRIIQGRSQLSVGFQLLSAKVFGRIIYCLRKSVKSNKKQSRHLEFNCLRLFMIGDYKLPNENWDHDVFFFSNVSTMKSKAKPVVVLLFGHKS